MRRRQVKRQIQIDDAEILAAAAPKRRTETVQCLGGAGLRTVYDLRNSFAALELVLRFGDQRVRRQELVESVEHLRRFILAGVARRPAAVGLHHTQRRWVELVGLLETLARVLLVARHVEN